MGLCMIVVDGKTYDVSVVEVNLDTNFIYKYATRNENYDLLYELGGVFFNQSITFGIGKSNSDFSELWDILSDKSSIDAGTGHNVQIWTPMGKMTFLMYPDTISVKLVREKGTSTWWSGMSVKFIGVKPARK